MSNQTTWTDDAGNIYNSNATNPLPVRLYATGAGATIGIVDGVGGNPGLYTSSQNFIYDGSVWRYFGTRQATAANLVAASASGNSADLFAGGAKGVKVIVDITAITGTTPTLTVTIQGKDPASGKYFTILQSVALNTVSTTVLTVYPALTAAANVTASDVLTPTWRISYAIGGTGPAVTGTIGVAPVL